MPRIQSDFHALKKKEDILAMRVDASRDRPHITGVGQG